MLEDLPQGVLHLFLFYYLFSKLQVTINKLIKLTFLSLSLKEITLGGLQTPQVGEIYALATFKSKVYAEGDRAVTLLPIS